MSKLRKNSIACAGYVPNEAVDPYRLSGLARQKRDLASPYIVTAFPPSIPDRLRFNKVENAILSAAFAREIGKPLLYQLVVRNPDTHNDPAGLFELIRNKLSEWLHNNDDLAAYVWTEEANGGPHIHILLHVSQDKKPKCARLVRKWLTDALGIRHLPKGAMSFTKIWGSGDPDQNVKNRLRYILKRADTKTRYFIGCEAKYDFGMTTGRKATGVSQALGEAARKQAGGVQLSGCRGVSAEMLAAADGSNAAWPEVQQDYNKASATALK
jgi:hypothetical protein|tara:strand:+ start:3872 stop:4678 length:807 start_codon:yes stop_codon:yes gene_type:complete